MEASSLPRIVWIPLSVFLLLTSTPDAYGIARSGGGEPIRTQAEQRTQGDGFVEPKPGRPGHNPHDAWYLGVYGKYTETGLLLTEVYPNTAAARAGLEVGDRIVAVNGHQIGIVFNTRANLDVALQRHAGLHGWVRLLVQDRRTKQLVTLDILLTRGRIHT